MHQTIVLGNLGRDPEYKKFDNGGRVANFSIGVTERGYKTESGYEVPPHTEWYRCVAKNGYADFVANYCKKGHKVQVIARKHTRKYTDEKGAEHSIEEFIVSNIELLTPKEKREEPTPVEEPVVPPVEEIFEENKQELPF